MFPLITAFSIICLADNGRSAVVRNIFGGGGSNEGLGLLSFSFDWSLITQAYPLYWPLQTQVSSWIGLAFGYALMSESRHIIPLSHHSSIRYQPDAIIQTCSRGIRGGYRSCQLRCSLVMAHRTTNPRSLPPTIHSTRQSMLKLDPRTYINRHSNLFVMKILFRFMTTTYAVSLLMSYASMGAACSHILLWHWRELWGAFKGFNFLKSEQEFDE